MKLEANPECSPQMALGRGPMLLRVMLQYHDKRMIKSIDSELTTSRDVLITMSIVYWPTMWLIEAQGALSLHAFIMTTVTYTQATILLQLDPMTQLSIRQKSKVHL
jgi:hypothetical protein